jgi:hypothetical protein
MQVQKACSQSDAGKPYEHTQVHQLRNGSSVLEFKIVTKHEGATASIKGLCGCTDSVPYASIEFARQHWEHLVDLGWKPSDA